MHSDHHLFYPATPTQTRSPPRRSRPLDASPLRRAYRPSPYHTTALVLAQSQVIRPCDAVSDDEDDALVSPLVRYSAYTSPRPPVRLSAPKPTPFGENRNTKLAGTRRPRESNGEKSRKPRSVETAPRPNAPLKTRASNRGKPRASAPSRINASSASSASILGSLPPPQLQSTPDRPVFDLGKLMKTGDSLKKMSLEDNKARCLDWSPTWSDSDASPLARRAFQHFGIMGPPPVPRQTGGIFESIGDSPAPRLNLFASPSTVSPVTAPSFQRHVSHAQVLFGGPAIDPPEPQVATAPAAPEPEEESPFSFGQAEDDSFTFDSSFSIPFLSEPGLSKKFKPHDSGIVVSDESDGSPAGLKQTMPLASSTSSLPEKEESDFCTETPILSARRKSSAWAVPAVELVETSLEDERALKILLQQGVTGQAQDKEKIAVPGTPVKRNHIHKLFATAPKSRTFHVPAWDIKAPRKSMPVTSFNPVGQAARSPARAPRKTGLALAIDTKLDSNVSSIWDNKFRPFSTTSSSGESLSATSSLENTPTHGRANAKKSLQRLHLPSRASHAFVQQEEISDINCPGRFEGQFALIDELGNGQFGIVLHVKDKRTEVEYAIKKSRRFEGVRNRKRLWEEVEILKALNARGGHENVLDFVDGWDEDDHLFIQTSLCAMGNLETFLNGFGRLFDRLGEAQVWKIITDVADGLQFIHQRGYIHMDIKPANIFVSDEGRLLIGDFGMASVWPRVKEEGFEREGDREYMAPEVLLGVYGKAADIFSFGMMVLEATANIVVPDMGTPWHKLREDKFDDVDFQHCSAALITLIRGLMRRDAGLRPTIEQVCTEKPVQRGRAWMSEKRTEATLNGSSLFRGSPLAGESEGFLPEVLGIGEDCDGMEWCL